ncbi:hypothetical protein EON65_52510 [archaeon]|nr:MAG: hypothetical protein EON65_52510 [archaeon]
MWNNKRLENTAGRKNHNEKRVTANLGAMVMKREFHTWELDDDQSVVSKKEEKKEESKIDPNLPNAKNLILQGLPKDLDFSSESEDDEEKQTDKPTSKRSSSNNKALATVDEKEDNSDEYENVPPSQQKTLVPMLSEEEIEVISVVEYYVCIQLLVKFPSSLYIYPCI